MAVKQEILCALLGALLRQGAIDESVYNKAINSVHSTIDISDNFEYAVHCRREAKNIGCAQDQTGNAAGQVVL